LTLDNQDATESDATTLCKACGLCCTGHLFEWAKLKSTELKTAASLGLKVLGSEPGQRGFNQPCPVWDGQCTIYSSPYYPHFCRLYKCSLLKKVFDDRVSLPEALTVVQQTKESITQLELMLPGPVTENFRKRLLSELEQRSADVEFQRKARTLLSVYRDQFGVRDFAEQLDEWTDLA
jgi:hypothetical protein